MEVLSNLIIELYRAAQGMAVDEFQEFSLGLLNTLVPFDSARYAGVILTQQGMQTQEGFLRNKPLDVISGHAAIMHADPVLRAVRAKPGKGVRFHPPTLFAGKENRPLFDYARRFENGNGMAMARIDQDSPHAQVITIWRADEDSHFLKQDGWVAEQVLPHMFEALKVNHALAVHRSVNDADRSTVAIARQNGELHFCGMGFRKLVNMEWPDWESAILPSMLMDELARIGSTDFCTATIRVSVKRVGELLFLKAGRVAALAMPKFRPDFLQSAYGLTPAEVRVALVLLEGSSAREVADYLNVSHHTVRTQIKEIYAKLGVGTRARFVKRMLELTQ